LGVIDITASGCYFLGMSTEQLQPDNYHALSLEASREKNWYGAEDFCRKSWEPIRPYLIKTLFSSKVEIRSLGAPGTDFTFRDLRESEKQGKALESMGAEFKFSGGTFGPFMKVEIDGQKKLLFKVVRRIGGGENGCDGGVILLSPHTKPFEQSWLRSIVIGVDGKNFAFVFGDNPTEGKGGNCYALSYRQTFMFEQTDVPYVIA
jgi:hypothetical protein